MHARPYIGGLLVPNRSAVVRHHRRGPFGFTSVAIPRGREFLDSGHGLLSQGYRLTCDTCFAEVFEVGLSSIERVNKLPKRRHDGVGLRHLWIAAQESRRL